MKMMKKDDKKTRGQKAESKRMTAQGVSEAKGRLKELRKQKNANPGIGFVVSKKEMKMLRDFVKKYDKK